MNAKNGKNKLNITEQWGYSQGVKETHAEILGLVEATVHQTIP